MTAWADILQSRVNLDQVVKRTRNSLHLRVDSERVMAICIPPGGIPLHARHPRTGLWVPAEYAQPCLIDRILERVNRPLVDMLAGPLAAVTLNQDASSTDGNIGGWIRGSNAAYATARSTSTGTFAGLQVGQFGPGTFYCYRSFLRYDTSSIPDDVTINQVNLSMSIGVDTSATDFDLNVVDCAWAATLVGNQEANYDLALSAATAGLWRNTAGASANTAYVSANLTLTVDVTGYTYIALVSGRDQAATQPAGGEYLTLNLPSHGTAGLRPFLSVIYTLNYQLGNAGRPMTLVEYASPGLIPNGLRRVAFITGANPPDYVKKVQPTWVASPNLAAANSICYGAVKYATVDLVPAALVHMVSG